MALEHLSWGGGDSYSHASSKDLGCKSDYRRPFVGPPIGPSSDPLFM